MRTGVAPDQLAHLQFLIQVDETFFYNIADTIAFTSDLTTAQAELELLCLHMSKSLFLHDMTNNHFSTVSFAVMFHVGRIYFLHA